MSNERAPAPRKRRPRRRRHKHIGPYRRNGWCPECAKWMGETVIIPHRTDAEEEAAEPEHEPTDLPPTVDLGSTLGSRSAAAHTCRKEGCGKPVLLRVRTESSGRKRIRPDRFCVEHRPGAGVIRKCIVDGCDQPGRLRMRNGRSAGRRPYCEAHDLASERLARAEQRGTAA